MIKIETLTIVYNVPLIDSILIMGNTILHEIIENSVAKKNVVWFWMDYILNINKNARRLGIFNKSICLLTDFTLLGWLEGKKHLYEYFMLCCW